MPPREASNSFADQYLTIDYESVNTLLHDPPPPQAHPTQTHPPPPNDLNHNLDSDDDSNNLPHTNVFIEEESYYDPNPTLGTLPPPTVSPNRNTLISSELDLDPLSLDPSESDLTLFLRSSLEETGEPRRREFARFLLHRRGVNVSLGTSLGQMGLPDAPVSRLGSRTVSNLSIASGYYTGTNVENGMESIPDLDVTMDTDDESTSSPDNLDTHIPQTDLNLISNTTTLADLKHFTENGLLQAVLPSLTTPRLLALGTRMLADYAKNSERRNAVASNPRILTFCIAVMQQASKHTPQDGERAVEYAVETIRSLTATEEADEALMRAPGLLDALADLAEGRANSKSRLHACIAIMNLSCGKSNKLEIARAPKVLIAMRTVISETRRSSRGYEIESRLKAATCIKNLSNADANDGALLGTPGLVEALGRVIVTSLRVYEVEDRKSAAATTVTNGCLALMNLSIAKQNKHLVFQTPGVMDALMLVTRSAAPLKEARIKACSALSNLAIGYDNKIPMFRYPGFVDAILGVIRSDEGEARIKACSILWSFAAEMRNQVPVVQRGDILPTLVQVAATDTQTEARFKCVAALTLLAESLPNALPLLPALTPLMDILSDAGPDPTQWKGQTASWCVGFLMNMAQADDAVPHLRDAGVVQLLAPLLTLDHYQSLKAAMAVTFVCRYDEDDETYDLLRKTETVIPKIINLLHNTLSARGGSGYKYGVFTLRSSVGCIQSLASGPDFMKERMATGPVYDSLLRVVSDFCVESTPGAIVGGGVEDAASPTLAVRALHSLTGHLIPHPGDPFPYGKRMEGRLIKALRGFETSSHPELRNSDRMLARDARRLLQGEGQVHANVHANVNAPCFQEDIRIEKVESGGELGPGCCCDIPDIPRFSASTFVESVQRVVGATTHHTQARRKSLNRSPTPTNISPLNYASSQHSASTASTNNTRPQGATISDPVRTFLLSDENGRRFAVPIDPSGGRVFNDARVWCYRRGRYCKEEERPDEGFRWTGALQAAYEIAVARLRASGEMEGVVTTTRSY
mmetsp:Transcript_53967/g.64931  ORF Transcript_53967/g.64931 Transcript_53967/m.64931 type:complete len:1036 (+) Transcript_53967:461-3568(+)